MWADYIDLSLNSLATSLEGYIDGGLSLGSSCWRQISRTAFLDFCNTIGTKTDIAWCHHRCPFSGGKADGPVAGRMSPFGPRADIRAFAEPLVVFRVPSPGNRTFEQSAT